MRLAVRETVRREPLSFIFTCGQVFLSTDSGFGQFFIPLFVLIILFFYIFVSYLLRTFFPIGLPFDRQNNLIFLAQRSLL